MCESIDSTFFTHVSVCSNNIQEMCDKAVGKNSKMLKFVLDYLKTQQM